MRKIIILFLFFQSIISAQNNAVLKVDGEHTSLENLLQQYIQIPSVSGNEKEAGDFFKSVCKENDLIITEFGNENGNYNFTASIFPLSDNKPNIILLNHIDVVPESDHGKFKPFSGEIEDRHVYGRGAFDNKGAAVMQLASILQFAQNNSFKNSKYNITLLTVSCEEIQCEGGIKYVINNHLDKLNPAVVIGEGPTELSTLLEEEIQNKIFGVSVAHKRTFWLNLNLKVPTSGHGSVTPLSYANKEMVNSLEHLINKNQKAHFTDLNKNILKDLAIHRKGIERFILKHPGFFKVILIPQLRKQPELFALFSNTVTLTNFNSNNTAYNKIPNSVTAYLDCRLLPQTDEKEFLRKVRKRLKNDSIRISIVDNIPRTTPSTTNNIYYKNIEKAIKLNFNDSEVIPLMLPNINDLWAFRVHNIPAYATIPVIIDREIINGIHNSNEKIPIKALYEGSKVYSDFLKLMAGN
ncbi:MAG: M20/M25/M40 family metallo-hydrolase [Bacteroidota bacterium]